MSVLTDKFGTEKPSLADLCKVCGNDYGKHAGSECPVDVHPPNPFDAQDAAGFVTVCGWCPELHILKLPRRDLDVIVIMQMGKGVTDVQIQRNGERLTISHGMCPSCKSAQLQSVSREAVAPANPAENAAETSAGGPREEKKADPPALAAPSESEIIVKLRMAMDEVKRRWQESEGSWAVIDFLSAATQESHWMHKIVEAERLSNPYMPSGYLVSQ
jgi:hypothetical protein